MSSPSSTLGIWNMTTIYRLVGIVLLLAGTLPAEAQEVRYSKEPGPKWNIPCPESFQVINDFFDCRDPVLCLTYEQTRPQPIDEEVAELWQESCRAYALMPEGWDHWTPASGLFFLGRLLPGEAFHWPGADGEPYAYSGTQAILDGIVGVKALTPLGSSPLWGCGEENIVPAAADPILEAGVCLHNKNTLMVSPYYRNMHRDIGGGPLLVRCDGEAMGRELSYSQPDEGVDEDAMAESGAIASEVLERLGNIAGYELVCLDQEAAEHRRAARLADPERANFLKE